MLTKKLTTGGQKAYQRSSFEDRSIPYRNWLRTVKTDGFYVDIDLIKLRSAEGEVVPRALTELTRCDYETITDAYLQAVEDRFFKRDKQGGIIQTLAELLKIPAYLVVFQKDMKWLFVFSFQSKKWRKFTKENWEIFLRAL